MDISGYRLPGEWERQEAVWFAWPTRDDLWPGALGRVRGQLVDLYRLAAQYQTVRVLCPESALVDLSARLTAQGKADRIELFDYETDDIWIRDFGPLFLVNDRDGRRCVVDWRYNAWGDKFPQQARDDAASAWIAKQLKMPHRRVEQVLEGGAIDSNGEGQLLTTEAVLLHPNRNGRMSYLQMEGYLGAGLNINRVVWLPEGLVGDDTDGHVDNVARFFRPDGMLVASPPGSYCPNRLPLEKVHRKLRDLCTSGKGAFEVVELRLPDPIAVDGVPLAASYLNFLVLNGAVLVPTFRQSERDQEAISTLKRCFPGRAVLGFDCTDIIREGGALHCMSQNEFAAE